MSRFETRPRLRIRARFGRWSWEKATVTDSIFKGFSESCQN